MFHTRTPTHCSRPVLHPEDSSFQTLKWEDRQTQTGCRQEKEKLWRQLLSVNNDIVSIVVVFFFFLVVLLFLRPLADFHFLFFFPLFPSHAALLILLIALLSQVVTDQKKQRQPGYRGTEGWSSYTAF